MASGTVGVIFMAAVTSVTGIVMAPLMAQFGWSRALITANVLISSTMTLLLAPVVGHLVSAYGARRCAMTAIALSAPALVLIGLSGGSPWTWIGTWIVFSVVNVGLSPMVWSSAVAGLFDRARGIALAITLSGAGVAFIVFPPFAVLILEHFGWRGVYFGLAIMMVAIMLPLAFAWFYAREDLSAREGVSAGDHAVGKPAGFALSQALRMRQFWQFALLAFLLALAEGAMQIHLFPILHEGGIAPVVAAWIASLMGVAMIVGRLLAGLLLDLLPPVPVFVTSILLVLASCLLARQFDGSAALGAAIALSLGLGTGGTTNALAYLSSRYFGLAAYASIYGLLMGAFSIGYGIAPVVAGHMREGAQSYAPIFNWLLAALTMSTVLTLALGRPKALPTQAN